MGDLDRKDSERKHCWYNNPDRGEGARSLFHKAQQGDTLNSHRRELAKRDQSAHEGMALTCYGASGYGTDQPYAFPYVQNPGDTEDTKQIDSPIIINLFKAITNTLVAKIAARNKPKTAVVTSYGKWRDKRNAVKIKRLIEADFQQSPGWQFPTLYSMTEHGFKLAHASTGTVAVKVSEYPNSSEVCYELHDTLDFAFDYDELSYGSPMTMCVTTWWDPEELIAHFDEFETEIWERLEEPPEGVSPVQGDGKRARMVRVVEGWRLSSADGTPGAYMICLKDGIDMTDEDDREYDYRTFPVAFYQCDKHLYGPWATSTTSLIYDLVRIANECTLSMAQAEKMVPKALAVVDEEAVEVDDLAAWRDFTRLRRKTGTTVDHVRGNAVEVFNPAMFDRINIQFVDWLIGLAHNVSGMPESQTAAIKESGLPSAEAQRHIAAIASERFQQAVDNYVQWVAVDIPKLALRAQRRIHERDGAFKRNWLKTANDNSSAKFMREVSSEVLDDFDDNMYVLQPAAMGGTKDTPADRVQTALEGVQMGMMSPQRYGGVLQHLDTPGELMTGQQEFWENEMDRWLFADPEEVAEPGFYQGPLPAMNLDDATMQVLEGFFKAYAELSRDEEEDYRLDFFTQALTEIDALAMQKLAAMSQAQAAGAPAPAPAPAQPVAA